MVTDAGLYIDIEDRLTALLGAGCARPADRRSVTESRTEFIALCQALIRSVRSGGHLVAAFMERMPSYRFGDGPQWPGYPVDSDMVHGFLRDSPTTLVIDRIDSDPSLPDYGTPGWSS